MELKETVDLMLSEDWRERLQAEYWQTKQRVDKLDDYIKDADEGKPVDAEDSVEILMAQGSAMHEYLYFLEVRMKMYGLLEDKEA